MEFEWDPAKAASNLTKHGIDFDEAIAVFDDPRVLSIADLRSYGETRYVAIERFEVERSQWCTPCGTTRYAASLVRGERAVVKDQLIRYRPGIDPKPQGKTDWDRVDKMTDEEVEAAALSDPDAQPLTDEQLARGFRPGKLVALRRRLRLNQAEFARRFRIDLDTLKGWEQGFSAPDDIARVYLRVIERNPDAVAAALED
jgi:putative transcriptional regulator